MDPHIRPNTCCLLEYRLLTDPDHPAAAILPFSHLTILNLSCASQWNLFSFRPLINEVYWNKARQQSPQKHINAYQQHSIYSNVLQPISYPNFKQLKYSIEVTLHEFLSTVCAGPNTWRKPCYSNAFGLVDKLLSSWKAKIQTLIDCQ